MAQYILQIPFLVSCKAYTAFGGDRGTFLLFKNFYKGKVFFSTDNCS